MDHMSALDSTFLHAEDGITHMHIGSCAIFDGPRPGFDEILALIAGKLPQIPRYRQKVRFVPGDIGLPVWVDDAAFDLAYHVRHTALPEPASVADLDTVIGRVMSQELDRSRPLWEAWMIDGLPEDRWALVSKVHHCMVDGVAGADLMTTLLDDRADAAPPEPDTWVPADEPTDAMLVAESMGRLFVHRTARTRALRPLVPAPTRPAAQIRTTFAALRSLGRLTTRLPASSIQGGIGPHRRWSAAHADLADIKAIKGAFGGTVNDVVLAVIAGAFRDLLADLGEDPDHAVLRTLVPVSVRSDGDDAPNNQVAAMIAELPIGIADPLERLASIRDQMEHLKASGQADTTQTLTTLAGLTAPVRPRAGAAGRHRHRPSRPPARRGHGHHERPRPRPHPVRRRTKDGRLPTVRADRPRRPHRGGDPELRRQGQLRGHRRLRHRPRRRAPLPIDRVGNRRLARTGTPLDRVAEVTLSSGPAAGPAR